MNDLEKNNGNKIHEQVVLERILRVNYNRYSTRSMSISHDEYWQKVDGTYKNEAVRSLSVLLEKGWSIVTVTKAFFTYKDGNDTKTYGVETAVLEKY